MQSAFFRRPKRPLPQVFVTDPAPVFAAGLRCMHEQRMKAPPLAASHLSVRVFPFRRAGRHWLGTVVTPWSVLAVLACGDPRHWKPLPAGSAVDLTLAGGDFTFLAVDDPQLGHYFCCTLKSPVADFENQLAADTFARTCLDLMTTPPPPERPAGEAFLSRRSFFTHLAGKEAPC